VPWSPTTPRAQRSFQARAVLPPDEYDKKTPAVTNERPESPAAITQPVFKLFLLDARSSRASRSGDATVPVVGSRRLGENEVEWETTRKLSLQFLFIFTCATNDSNFEVVGVTFLTDPLAFLELPRCPRAAGACPARVIVREPAIGAKPWRVHESPKTRVLRALRAIASTSTRCDLRHDLALLERGFANALARDELRRRAKLRETTRSRARTYRSVARVLTGRERDLREPREISVPRDARVLRHASLASQKLFHVRLLRHASM